MSALVMMGRLRATAFSEGFRSEFELIKSRGLLLLRRRPAVMKVVCSLAANTAPPNFRCLATRQAKRRDSQWWALG